jgi:hypothetical protein
MTTAMQGWAERAGYSLLQYDDYDWLAATWDREAPAVVRDDSRITCDAIAAPYRG